MNLLIFCQKLWKKVEFLRKFYDFYRLKTKLERQIDKSNQNWKFYLKFSYGVKKKNTLKFCLNLQMKCWLKLSLNNKDLRQKWL